MSLEKAPYSKRDGKKCGAICVAEVVSLKIFRKGYGGEKVAGLKGVKRVVFECVRRG